MCTNVSATFSIAINFLIPPLSVTVIHIVIMRIRDSFDHAAQNKQQKDNNIDKLNFLEFFTPFQYHGVVNNEIIKKGRTLNTMRAFGLNTENKTIFKYSVSIGTLDSFSNYN